MCDEHVLKEAIACAYKYWPRVGESPDKAREIKKARERKVRQGTLEWHDSLYAALSKHFPEYAFQDYTDEDGDACCVGYRMLLHAGQPWLDGDAELADALGGGWHELYIYCSVLGPFAYLECEKADFCRIPEGDRWEFSLQDITSFPEAMEVANFLHDFGFACLSTQLVRHSVPDLEVEFAKDGEVNIFSCLFEGIFTETIGRSDGVYVRPVVFD